MYIPDGVDDVGVPWHVTVGVIECKSILKLHFCAILCNAYALKLEGWSLKQRLLVSRADHVVSSLSSTIECRNMETVEASGPEPTVCLD